MGPADGSDYLIGQYGPALSKVAMQNYTYFRYGSYYYKQHEEFYKTLKLDKTFDYFDEIHFRVLGTDL